MELLLLYDIVKSHFRPALNLGKYPYKGCLPRPLLYEFLQILLYSPLYVMNLVCCIDILEGGTMVQEVKC